MGLQRTAKTLAQKKSLRLETTQTAKLNLAADAEVPHEKFSRLWECNPRFKLTYERKRRGRAWLPRDCDKALATLVAADEWTDQEIANLIIASRRNHSEASELSQDYHRWLIAEARKEHARSIAQEALHNDNSTPQETLANISTVIGLPIVSFKRYMADPPKYVLQLGNGRTIQLKNSNSFVEQASFRKVLIDYGNYNMPVFKPAIWHDIVTRMLETIEDVQVSGEATHLGSTTDWLKSFVRAYVRTERVDEAQRRGILDGNPGLMNGDVWFSMAGLRKYIKVEFSENPSTGDLTVWLKQIGCQFESCKTIRIGEDVRASRSLWKIPEGLFPESELGISEVMTSGQKTAAKRGVLTP